MGCLLIYLMRRGWSFDGGETVNIERCDGCGQDSPDGDGLHVANEWFEVVIVERSMKPRGGTAFLFCPACLGFRELPKRPWWRQLGRRVRRWGKRRVRR